jgi:hypothetical protein
MDHPETEIHGPFIPEHRVTVGGYAVPAISVVPLTGEEDGRSNVVLDGRFCLMADAEEIRRWMPLVAHAMAIGAGYTCHGENSRRANPYRVRMMRIDSQENLGDGQP